MNKNVVLFLTTPNSPSRIQMSLENFKQLEKLGLDIITLTTTDFLSDYIYEKSKYVIHDYNQHKCYKYDYYKYYKDSQGSGYFFWDYNSAHTVHLFQETHFPSLLRNTRTLIHFATSLSYEKYFFVEDDHFFHDDDLFKLKNYYESLETNDMIVFSFRRFRHGDEHVYCTWFHFGNLNKSNKLFKNFAYTNTEFLLNPELYLHFYEAIFKKLINIYKDEDFKLLEVTEGLTGEIFTNSKLNKIYSHQNIDDDSRCNLIFNKKDNNIVFYYTTLNLNKTINIKMYLENRIFSERNIYPGCWFTLPIHELDINKIDVVLNDTVRKNFKNLKLSDIVYNGELF